jgi:c-di-GMP phosphodiesterase
VATRAPCPAISSWSRSSRTCPPTPDVLEACRALKAGGCAIALDDIVTTAPPRGFLDLADIVKVDFAKTSAFRRHQIARALRRPGTKMLAEKVETQEDFNQALHGGYEYFQGCFFARPSIVVGWAIPASKLNILNLISEVHRPDLVHAHVENIIKHEVSLTLKLLTHLRTAAGIPPSHRIDPARHSPLRGPGLEEVGLSGGDGRAG